MRTTPTGTYDPPDIITSAWGINYWLIDANTHVLSPLMKTSVITRMPSIVTIQLEANAAIQAENKYLSATIAIVVMYPYEARSSYALQCTTCFKWIVN